MRSALFSVTAGLIASAAIAAPVAVAPDAPKYSIAMRLFDGERIIGKPQLTVGANQLARIEVGEDDGSRYSLSVRLTPQPNQRVRITSQITVAPVGRTERKFTPTLVVGFGQQSAIEYGVESPVEKPFRMTLTVNPVAA